MPLVCRHWTRTYLQQGGGLVQHLSWTSGWKYAWRWDRNIVKVMTGSLESGKRRKCPLQWSMLPSANIRCSGYGVLWSRAWSYFLGFSGAAQGENPFLVKVTVGHICSNLPEAASGDFGHTAKWQKMFPSSDVETHCSCGSPSRDGACWNQKLHVDGHDGCWPESLTSKLLITNCYYSLINTLWMFFPWRTTTFSPQKSNYCNITFPAG